MSFQPGAALAIGDVTGDGRLIVVVTGENQRGMARRPDCLQGPPEGRADVTAVALGSGLVRWG